MFVCRCTYLNGGYSHEGIRMVHRLVEDIQLQEGSSGEGSPRSLDIVHDDGGDDYGHFPTFFSQEID